MIKTIAKPAEKKVTACGECRSTCLDHNNLAL